MVKVCKMEMSIFFAFKEAVSLPADMNITIFVCINMHIQIYLGKIPDLSRVKWVGKIWFVGALFRYCKYQFISLWTCDASYIWIYIGSDNGLLPDGNKPLPKPMLTCHQLASVAFTWEQFHSMCPLPKLLLCIFLKLYFKNCWHISWEPII